MIEDNLIIILESIDEEGFDRILGRNEELVKSSSHFETINKM